MGQVHPHSAYRGSSQPPKSLQQALMGGGGEQWGNTGHKVNVVALGGLGGPPHGQEPPTMGAELCTQAVPPPPPPLRDAGGRGWEGFVVHFFFKFNL